MKIDAVGGETVEALRTLARGLTVPGQKWQELIPRAQALRDLFEEVTRFEVDWERDPAPHGTRLDSGLAISPTYAAMCIRELARTTVFIRGVAQAIREARRPGRPVHVLYAGCGPYALLALPLMTLYAKEEVVFTLLEIHPQVLDSALQLIAAFGCSDRVASAVCTDATRYRIPDGQRPDVIVSETMAVCLHNEPQVTIARRLLEQAPEALLVPNSVRVELSLLNPSREHRFVPADYAGEIPPPERERLPVGTVFELAPLRIREWTGLAGEWLPGNEVQLPAPLPAGLVPHLLTTIVAFGENRLQDYDCSLTLPRRLPGGEHLRGGETLQFRYRLGANPRLEFSPGSA